MAKFYAGIGSRETPADVLALMGRVAAHLVGLGYTLRSGHADGADLAFERGALEAGGAVDLYLPWPKFNGPPAGEGARVVCLPRTQLLERYAYLQRLGIRYAGTPKEAVQLLHGRNVCQVEGEKEGDTPVKFVICWCPVVSGEPQGGTATAVKLARHHDILVLNLWWAADRHRVEQQLSK